MSALGSMLLLVALQGPDGSLVALRSPREVVRALEERLRSRPDDTALRRALVRCELDLGAGAAALGHMRDAGPDFDGLRGRAHYLLGHYEEALGLLDPSDPVAVLLVVDAFEALGRLDEIDAAIDRAAAALGEDEVAVLVLRGRASARAGDLRGAVERFERARARDPRDPQALFGLGQALVRLGERERAAAVLEEHRRLLPRLDALEFARAGLRLDPLHAPNHAAMGDAERALGRVDSAEAAYRRASELARGAELVPIALRHARLLSEDRSDVAAATALLRAAAARVPDARLPVREGDLLAGAGDLRGALEAWRRAARLRPGDRAIAERIARVAGEDGG